MRVVKEVEDGVVRRVRVLDDSGAELEPVVRFLSHLMDSSYSPNTVCAYAYDLRHLTELLDDRSFGVERLSLVNGAGVPGLPAPGPLESARRSCWG
ncbi:MAG: site-specific integrase [Actinomycetota bacterium]|nr:site-specific integrase [Actinomycetota bacterium]